MTQGEVTYRLAAAVGFMLVGLQFTHRQHPSSPLTDLILNIKVFIDFILMFTFASC